MKTQILPNKELDILRYAINNSEEEISFCDINGNIIFSNERTWQHHKINDNLKVHSIFEFNITEFKNNGWDTFIQSIRENGNTLKRLFTKKISEHNIIYYDVRTNIITEDNIDYVWFFANDITREVTQGNKVKELNYVMDAILNNIPVYLFVKDSANDFRYIYWNKSFENYSGIPASKTIGYTDFEIFPNHADAEKFRKDDLTLLHKGSPIEYDEEFTDSSGNIRYTHTLKAIIKSDKELPWIIGVSWDITDLKKTERELIAARVKAEQSDKLKSAFLANMSHEIRTPLNAIVGFSKLLKEASSDEVEQYHNIIDDNSNLLLQLINDILDISKIEAGTLDFVENTVLLNDLFSDVYQIHRHRVTNNVKLIYEEYLTPIEIRCDRNRLLQVVTNLITNAIKFTQHGEIRFGFTQKGDDIEIFITDTGIGISKDNLNNIFNRFAKLNNFIQGTGLGLPICRTIIDKMDGKIWVKSQENEGSTFFVTIPYRKDTQKTKHNVEKKENTVDVVFNQRKRILIAEDTDSNYILMCKILSPNYDLCRAVDGNEAIDKFKEYNPDIIFMDIKMPIKDGLEATREIRKTSEVPIIAVTSFAYDSDRKTALESGCNDFITKPVSLDILNRTIDKYI